MKDLLSQNNFKFDKIEFKKFVCNDCGAIFQSDEYTTRESKKDINMSYFIDTCITCKSECIISELKNASN